MFNHLLTSTIVHMILLLGLCFSPEVYTIPKTSSGDAIQVTIINSGKTGTLLATHRNYVKSRGAGSKKTILKKVDLTNYANRLKLQIDPVWFSYVNPLRPKLKHSYTTILLILVDKHGNIKSTRIIKNSGDQMLDELANQVFREIGRLPEPPEEVIKDGIIWDFTVSKGND